jgi:hypothetical protein
LTLGYVFEEQRLPRIPDSKHQERDPEKSLLMMCGKNILNFSSSAKLKAGLVA